MSSILTNTSAMTALQTLKSVNMNLNKTQDEIATGKSVGSAKDNAAVWAISKVMESDVEGFKGISDSLNIGGSTVAVARTAAETLTKLLIDIKGKIVAAQGENVDRAKLQTDVAAYREQIVSVVNAAQFNGLNLVNGSVTGTNVNTQTGVNVLASLNRAADGTVTAGNIGVNAQNLSTTAGTAITAAAVTVTEGAAGTFAAADATAGAGADVITFTPLFFLDNAGGSTGAAALAPTTSGVVDTVATGLLAGDSVSLRIGTVEGVYTVQEGDTVATVVGGMKNALIAAGLDSSKFTLTANAADLIIENKTNNATVTYEQTASRGSGALSDLTAMDVSTAAGATTALADIETMLQSAIDAAASFGSVQSRIGIQSSFVSKLTDALKTGIGAMVDADMEEASARLQALQVQQQLGIQALSIANQAPQNVLSLFR